MRLGDPGLSCLLKGILLNRWLIELMRKMASQSSSSANLGVSPQQDGLYHLIPHGLNSCSHHYVCVCVWARLYETKVQALMEEIVDCSLPLHDLKVALSNVNVM